MKQPRVFTRASIKFKQIFGNFKNCNNTTILIKKKNCILKKENKFKIQKNFSSRKLNT